MKTFLLENSITTKTIFPLFIVLSFLTHQSLIAQYCDASLAGGSNLVSGISNITLLPINNSSPINQGYQDFTTIAGIGSFIVPTPSNLSVTTTSSQSFAAWIDWNQNNIFDHPSEQVINDTVDGTRIFSITAPNTAISGNTRMRVISGSVAGSAGKNPCPNSVVDGDIEDYTVNIQGLPMTFDSVLTENLVYGCFVNNKLKQQIIRVNVKTANSGSPLSLTNLTFNTASSSNPSNDIQNAQLYSTGTSNMFEIITSYGPVVTSPNGSFTFSGTSTLLPSDNFFWLTYDIPQEAEVGNTIEAELTQITVSGTSFSPDVASTNFTRVLDQRSNYQNKEANVWYVNANYGIDFNCQTPTIITDQSPLYNGTSRDEGNGSICDENGNLLFYVDYDQLFDRFHSQTPNGDSINGWSSKFHGLFIKQPGNDSIYYMFTGAQVGTGTPLNLLSALIYSEINLNLNNGRGDIISGTKNTDLIDGIHQETFGATTHCNGEDVWIVTIQESDNTFSAFLVNSTGISAPITSIPAVFPPSPLSTKGILKFSPNGKWMITNPLRRDSSAYIFSFDNATGVLSNPISLNTDMDVQSASFSPDNTKLYIYERSTLNIYQYDMCASDIPLSKTLIGSATLGGSSPGLWYMQNGPDGRIYMNGPTAATSTPLINNPNLLGTACDYSETGFFLDGQTTPSPIPQVPMTSIFNESIFNQFVNTSNGGFTASSSEICDGSISFTNTTTSLSGGCSSETINYFWDFGDGNTSTDESPNHTYTTGGTFTVKLAVQGNCQTDTLTQNIESNGQLVNELDFIPNVFSPNGDGLNDTYKIDGLASLCAEEVTIEIYNRWGQKVFESTDMLFEWDGKNESGNDVADGSYFIAISGLVSGKEVELSKNAVTLLRN